MMPALLALLLSVHAEAATRNVLVTGYWPPTNEMLRELRENGRNWRGLGYDVHAYFPERTGENGGIGFGDFRVDFAAVYDDFQRITQELHPVAILSFGAGAGPWEIETVFPPYFQGWFASGNIPSELGLRVRGPIPASLALGVERRSSLPREEILRAVAALGDRGLRPWIDETGGAGDYVCGFTGYLESWYHDEHASPLDPAENKAAGFIHVDGDPVRAKASMEASLEALLRSLGPVSE